MNSQPQSVVRANAASATRKNHAFFTISVIGLWAFWTAFASLNLYGQSYSELDLSDFTHSVQPANVLLMQGEKATFEVSLGVEDVPAENVVGIRLHLTLSSSAVVSDDPGISVDGSWCFESTNLYAATKWEYSPAAMWLTVRAADSSAQSGAGVIFSFEIEAAEDSVLANDLLAAFDGIVIVENIDMKQAQYPRAIAHSQSAMGAIPEIVPAATPSLRCYPNPTQGRLQWSWRKDAQDPSYNGNVQARLIGADGQIFLLNPGQVADEYVVDLAQYPAGIYQLQIERSGKVCFQERILKI